jgi:hypothetical protein
MELSNNAGSERIDSMSGQIKIVEKTTGLVVGEVVTSHSLSFYDACKLAGLEWKEWPEVECDGWYRDGILWDEAVAKLVSE